MVVGFYASLHGVDAHIDADTGFDAVAADVDVDFDDHTDVETDFVAVDFVAVDTGISLALGHKLIYVGELCQLPSPYSCSLDSGFQNSFLRVPIPLWFETD